jgi:hypothetical protein
VTYKKVKKLKAEDFKRTRASAFRNIQPNGGNSQKSRKLTPENRKTIEIKGRRQNLNDFRVFALYRTYFHLGAAWGVNESTAYPYY